MATYKIGRVYIENLQRSNHSEPKYKNMQENQHTGATCNEMPYPQPQQPMQTTEKPRIYSITLRQLDHGYIVQVGCKDFAIETPEKLSGLLAAYLANPEEIQKKYFEGKLL